MTTGTILEKLENYLHIADEKNKSYLHTFRR